MATTAGTHGSSAAAPAAPPTRFESNARIWIDDFKRSESVDLDRLRPVKLLQHHPPSPVYPGDAHWWRPPGPAGTQGRLQLLQQHPPRTKVALWLRRRRGRSGSLTASQRPRPPFPAPPPPAHPAPISAFNPRDCCGWSLLPSIPPSLRSPLPPSLAPSNPSSLLPPPSPHARRIAG